MKGKMLVLLVIALTLLLLATGAAGSSYPAMATLRSSASASSSNLIANPDFEAWYNTGGLLLPDGWSPRLQHEEVIASASQSIDVLSQISQIPGRGVLITDCRFDPSTIIVPRGATVGWLNASLEISHTVTSDTGLWDSEEIAPGGNYSRTFSTIGTFPYHDRVSPFLTGQIIVRHFVYFPLVVKNYTTPPTTGDVTGQVQPANNPCIGLEGATVTLVNTHPLTATTGTQGHYRLLEVPPDVYTATATLDGYLSQTQLVTVTAGDAAYANFALSRAPTQGGASFYIYNFLTGAPLEDVLVTLTGTLRLPPGGPESSQTFVLTTTTGFAATVDQPEGIYDVRATAPGFFTTLDINVIAGQQAVVSVMLSPPYTSPQVETRHSDSETQAAAVLPGNGDFNTGTLPPWTFSEYHNPGQPIASWAIPNWVSFANNRWLYRPLRLYRATCADGGGGAVSQTMNYDISGLCMLLDFDVAIKSQGFTGDLAYWGTYPAKVILSYRDPAGNAQTFTRAFYLEATRVDAFAEHIPRNQVIHRSYDLKAVTPPIKIITSIRLESSGWDWDAYFDNVSLIVDPNGVVVGQNKRFYDANSAASGGSAGGAAWHREKAYPPYKQAFSNSGAIGTSFPFFGGADSWAWVGRTFRVCGTAPRNAEVRVVGDYRGMVEAVAGYPSGSANYRWKVEATLRDLTTGNPGDVDTVLIASGSSATSLPHEEAQSFNVAFRVRSLQPWHQYRVELKISDEAQAVLVASAVADFYGRGDPSSIRYIRYDYINIEWR